MRRVIGQAAGKAGRLLHLLSRLMLLALLLTLVGMGVLAWRLGQGPLDVPWVAQELAALTNRQIAPMRLEIGKAALIWEGFSRGVDRPLDIRARDLIIYDGEGRVVAQVPEVFVSLSTRALVTGRIAPRGVLMQGARVQVVRNSDGRVAIALSGRQAAEAPADLPLDLAPAAPPADFTWVFEALAQPPGTDLGGRATLLSQLRQLRLRDTVVSVQDNVLGLAWQAPRLDLELTRAAAGGVDGTAAVELAVGDQRLVVDARLHLPSVSATPDGSVHPDGQAGAAPTLAVEATLATVVPAAFAALSPTFAPLAAVQTPVALTATAELGADLVPRQGRLQVRMSRGTLLIARGRIPISDAMAVIEGTRESMRLTLHRLALPRGGGEQTIVTGTATLQPQAGMLVGILDLQLDQVGFADLAALWPDGVGGPGAKPWITENITAGVAHDLRLQLRVIAAPDLSDGEVTGLSGTLEGRDMVVHWLRPVPPVEGVAARLTFVSANEIDIAVRAGSQGGLAVTDGQITLTGLAQHDQYMNIALNLGGPVSDLIGVLNHKRVNLLSRRPIAMRNPGGRVEGKLTVTAMPLLSDLTFDEVRLSATGRLSGLALGGIAAGRDLTNGALSFEAGNDGLQLRGTATLAGIATQLAVEMDFTDGPANQVIQKVTVSGIAEATKLVELGLDTKELVLDGSAALKLDLVGRRSGRSELAVRADLLRLGLRADRLNWGKAANRPTVAEATVILDRDRFAGIDKLRIEGEGVSVLGTLEAAAGAPRRLRLSRAVLAPGTDAVGDIQWPRDAGDPWVIRLSGASLDISGELAKREPPGEPVRGPPWNAELRVDRLVLGPERLISGVLARSDNDGLMTRTARVTGRAGTGPFEVSILPSGLAQRRSLTATAQDAGALLRALDVTDDMQGGRLVLNGSFDDSRPDHPLSGTAEVTEFGMRNAPAIGKLLQAITVFGAIEAFSGPDLRFSRLVAPFRYAGQVIELADARAFSASLGITAKGRIDIARRHLDLQGTVVPAYFLNSLLGRVPLLGRLLSPEAGGGLFAMSFGVKGPFDDPSVWVNPLSAVTPGFLRGLFGPFQGSAGGGGDTSGTPSPRPPRMPDGGQQ